MDKETRDEINQIKIDRAIDKGIHKWVRTVCVTSTMSFLGFCSWLANQMYDKFDAIQAGVKAFLENIRHGQ